MNIQYETDKICADAALLFRKLDQLDKERAALMSKLRKETVRYRDTARAYGFGVDHLRRACKIRGVL